MTYTADTPILGGPAVDPGVLAIALARRGQHTHDQISRITAGYTVLGQLFGTGNLFPFAQAWHETGAFTSPRWRQSFNPAGLGATNDGAWGGHFASEAEGIAAQLAHLLAYAIPPGMMTRPQLALVLLDPRLAAVAQQGWRGAAPTWRHLNGKWAFPGTEYGQRIATLASQLAP